MEITEFKQASLLMLEKATGICKTRWSRYLSGRVSVSEKTLSSAAEKLGMEPAELLKAIHDRRQAQLTTCSS